MPLPQGTPLPGLALPHGSCWLPDHMLTSHTPPGLGATAASPQGPGYRLWGWGIGLKILPLALPAGPVEPEFPTASPCPQT